MFRRFLFFKRGGTLRNTVDCRFRTCDLPKRSPKTGQQSLGSGVAVRSISTGSSILAKLRWHKNTQPGVPNGWYIAFVRSTVVLLWGIFSERFTLGSPIYSLVINSPPLFPSSNSSKTVVTYRYRSIASRVKMLSARRMSNRCSHTSRCCVFHTVSQVVRMLSDRCCS